MDKQDVTIMSADIFNTMIASLHKPDESPQLATLAALPRQIAHTEHG